MDDQSIVQLYLERNENAIVETDLKYGAYIGSVSLNILGNIADMEEAKNDTLSALWNSIPPSVPNNFKAFLTIVARRISLNLLRSKKRQTENLVDLSFEELDECFPSRANTKEALDRKELKRVLNSFLSSLPDSERRVFICRYFYCDSIAELSKHFVFSQSKIKMMLKRSREKLRKVLEKEDIYI